MKINAKYQENITRYVCKYCVKINAKYLEPYAESATTFLSNDLCPDGDIRCKKSAARFLELYRFLERTNITIETGKDYLPPVYCISRREKTYNCYIMIRVVAIEEGLEKLGINIKDPNLDCRRYNENSKARQKRN